MVDKRIIDQALLDRTNKKIVHCIEITPGAYLVSASFAHEIRQRAAKTEVIGDMFGVNIMTTDLLPMEVVEHKHDTPNPNIVPAHRCNRQVFDASIGKYRDRTAADDQYGRDIMRELGR